MVGTVCSWRQRLWQAYFTLRFSGSVSATSGGSQLLLIRIARLVPKEDGVRCVSEIVLKQTTATASPWPLFATAKDNATTASKEAETVLVIFLTWEKNAPNVNLVSKRATLRME